jgi:plastocyanin
MKRCILALVAAAGLLVAAAPAGAMTGSLKGTVGPGFTISLSAKTVKAGKYRIVVSDKGSIHNFHLMGPGVNKTTSISGTGTSTWNVTLKKGTYKYQCDVHASSMHGTLKVT